MKYSLFKLLLSCILWMTILSAAADNREMHYRLKAADITLTPKDRISYMDSLIAVSPSTTDSLLLVAAELASSSGLPKIASQKIEKLLSLHKAGNAPLTPSKECLALYILANSYFKNLQYADAITTSLQLLHTPKPDSLIYHDINCLTLMNEACPRTIINETDTDAGNMYSYIEKAEKLLHRSTELKMPQATLDNMRKSIIFSKMWLAIDNKEYDEALKRGAEMLQYPVTPIEQLALEGNLALIYFQMGNEKMAEEYYKKLLSEPGWHLNHASILGNYMFLLTERGEAEKALRLWEEHPEIISIAKDQNANAYSYLLSRRSYALAIKGDIDDSFKTYLKSAALNDSVNTMARDMLAEKLIDTLETNYLHDNRLKWDKTIITLLTVALIVAAASIIILLLRQRKRRITNETSLERKAGEDTDENEKSALSHIMQMASLNETVSSINSTIEDPSADDHTKLTAIKALLRDVTLCEDIWDSVSIQFEKLHPSFFSTLKEKHPDVTQGEMRMCAYVRLNMSNKEIATLTRRSLRSVETMRYRISKKFHLSQGESLLKYLLSLS